MPTVPDDTQVLILYGDVPLLTEQTLRELVAVAGADNLALLTVIAEDPSGYGRIVRDLSLIHI